MEEMQITSALTWIEVQFMKKAVEEVEKCRMTLKWTYAMAYYLAKGNEKELFEDNQRYRAFFDSNEHSGWFVGVRDLERAVEDLSELLESPIEPETIPTLRQSVTNKTVYVQKRNEIVLEDTANGFLEGRWRWNVAVEGFDDPEESWPRNGKFLLFWSLMLSNAIFIHIPWILPHSLGPIWCFC